MKSISAPKLVEFVAAIMEGGGCGAAEARTVAQRLVDSNLVGHDSHGVLRVAKYLEWVRDGTLKPNTAPTIVFDSDAIAIIDGNRGFGQVIGEFATRLGIAKAAKTGIAMIGLRNCGHLGRLGDWAEMAANAGQVSLHFLNTSGAQRVAPFGGSDRRLSTNPMAIGVPLAGAPPAILDITTSTVAEGKLMVALNKGVQVPEGWIVDKAGHPTTEPEGLLRWRSATHHRRAQGIGPVDPHRPARGRGDDRAQLGSRRHDPAQQHDVDLHRAGRVRRRRRRDGRGETVRRVGEGVAASEAGRARPRAG